MMIKELENLWKYLIGLSPINRSIAVILGFLIITSTIAFYKDQDNSRFHNIVKEELKGRLDTCEIRSLILIVQEDSLKNRIYQLSIDSAYRKAEYELLQVKKLANTAKQSEINVLSISKKIHKKIHILHNEK